MLHHQEKREGEGIDAPPKHRWCLKNTDSFKFKLFIVFGLKEKSKSEINLALWRKYFSTEHPGNPHWHLYCIWTIHDDDFRFWCKLTAIQTFTKPIWPQYLKNKNIAIISGKNMWNWYWWYYNSNCNPDFLLVVCRPQWNTFFGSWSKIFLWGLCKTLNSNLWICGWCCNNQWWEKSSFVFGTTSKGTLYGYAVFSFEVFIFYLFNACLLFSVKHFWSHKSLQFGIVNIWPWKSLRAQYTLCLT